MARCDQGYLCEVCGEEVESIRDSDLYLRFVTGEVDSRQLLAAPERHLRCNPVSAQFIEDGEFDPVAVDGAFSKTQLDRDFVRERTELLTRGWRRLQELAEIAQTVPLAEYPLPEFRCPVGE
ncbi:MAG: hypothetical protein R3C19_25090 [Planctomycetaceae bacterium]